MKLTIDPKVFAEAVTWAARNLPGRPAVPVLSGLLLVAETDQLTVSAFDYDVSVQATVAAEVATPGRVVIPGRVLAEIVKSLPGESWAELVLDGYEVALTCGRVAFTLMTLPESDYPTIPAPPAPLGAVDGPAFRVAIEQTAIAASEDDTVPGLTAVRIDAEGDRLTLAATDRYRIAVRDLPWSLRGMPPGGVLVHHDVVLDLAKGGISGEVALGWDDKLIGFCADGRVVTARLIDDKYINYRARIGWDHLPIAATVNRAALTTAIKRVSLLADKGMSVRLHFTSDGVLVQAGTGDLGRGTETVPCTLDGADAREIGFSPAFLLDAVGGVQQENVVLHMDPDHLQVLVRGQDSDSYQCLVLALRLA
ncbi:DNA polymerase III subunit beta [Acrocarpospora phusangensis]|uniref:Beta sliding clamp n=1 Tax=Acrocarpospora phusangensis TaxID=1070424 RepID=A0A919QBB6_9ACTN|nr:DNA polymerase III subunit beta [Acrocarpospora phusangensis]GIH26024.1 DNA polymerase III subunit beta [Acrocarpospora phusangensis]